MEPIAFLGLVPLMLLVTLMVLQVALVGYAAVVVEVAARDAVRAASIGDSPYAEVHAVQTATGVQMWLQVACVTGRSSVQVRVGGRAPRLLPALGDDLLAVVREAEAPVEVDCWF